MPIEINMLLPSPTQCNTHIARSIQLGEIGRSIYNIQNQSTFEVLKYNYLKKDPKIFKKPILEKLHKVLQKIFLKIYFRALQNYC